MHIKIYNFLVKKGLNPGVKGFKYIMYMMRLGIEQKDIITMPTHEMIELLAKEYNATIDGTERCLYFVLENFRKTYKGSFKIMSIINQLIIEYLSSEV